MLSETRDLAAATRFLALLEAGADGVGHTPETVTPDGHDAYPRAVRETLGEAVGHRTSRSLNHRLEQDHRGLTQRYDPMSGFGSVATAARFCTAYDELRDDVRCRQHPNETVPLAEQRRRFRERWSAVCTALRAA